MVVLLRLPQNLFLLNVKDIQYPFLHNEQPAKHFNTPI